MSWQDIVLLICQIVFAIALFPSILSNNKPALSTSVLNTVFLYIIFFVNLTLNLYGFAVGIFIVATLWLTLAVQKYLIDKKNK